MIDSSVLPPRHAGRRAVSACLPLQLLGAQRQGIELRAGLLGDRAVSHDVAQLRQ
jgi:hypothetical protein